MRRHTTHYSDVPKTRLQSDIVACFSRRTRQSPFQRAQNFWKNIRIIKTFCSNNCVDKYISKFVGDNMVLLFCQVSKNPLKGNDGLFALCYTLAARCKKVSMRMVKVLYKQ